MSLDVYLTIEGSNSGSVEREKIFVRRGGQTVEVSREEWDNDRPGEEPVTVSVADKPNEVFTYNITHNLNKMASEVVLRSIWKDYGKTLYDYLWRPDENAVERAHQLIDPLRVGLASLIDSPEYYKQFNPDNGWGSYDGLVEFVWRYLVACTENPQAKVSVWR